LREGESEEDKALVCREKNQAVEESGKITVRLHWNGILMIFL
jgi:hypothetical protein